jgi:hypothetical protein
MVEHRGYANVLTWLSDAGLQAWIRPAMLLILAAAGLWTWRYRHADIWILLGVGALVARLWTYHLVYDDVLILFPMIALFRIAKREATTWYGLGAAALLAVTLVSMLLPGRLLQLEPPWGTFLPDFACHPLARAVGVLAPLHSAARAGRAPIVGQVPGWNQLPSRG